jgi:hypothetical protein
MHGHVIQRGATTPSIEISFLNPTTGLPRTDLVFDTVSLAIGYRRPGGVVVSIPLIAQTVTGAWASGGFVNLSRGVYRLDLPILAAATAATPPNRFALVAITMPTDVVMVPCIVQLRPDDPAVALTTQVGAPSSATIAASVRDELLTVRWGVQTQPVDGSTQILTITDMPSSVALGVVRRYFESEANGGRLVGQTEITTS